MFSETDVCRSMLTFSNEKLIFSGAEAGNYEAFPGNVGKGQVYFLSQPRVFAPGWCESEAFKHPFCEFVIAFEVPQLENYCTLTVEVGSSRFFARLDKFLRQAMKRFKFSSSRVSSRN